MFDKEMIFQASNVCVKVKICNDISVFRKITRACGPAFPLDPCARASAKTGVPMCRFLGRPGPGGKVDRPPAKVWNNVCNKNNYLKVLLVIIQLYLEIVCKSDKQVILLYLL